MSLRWKREKRFHPWKSTYLITYKRLLRQEDGKLFCKYCTTRLTGHEFFKGWSGNKEGLKVKCSQHTTRNFFTRKLEQCTSNYVLFPQIRLLETWKSKISKNFNAELCSKFVASNLLATEHISNKKYRPVLKAFKKRTKFYKDSTSFCEVQADKILDDQQQRFECTESFGV